MLAWPVLHLPVWFQESRNEFFLRGALTRFLHYFLRGSLLGVLRATAIVVDPAIVMDQRNRLLGLFSVPDDRFESSRWIRLPVNPIVPPIAKLPMLPKLKDNDGSEPWLNSDREWPQNDRSDEHNLDNAKNDRRNPGVFSVFARLTTQCRLPPEHTDPWRYTLLHRTFVRAVHILGNRYW